jgi:hypothetical protein
MDGVGERVMKFLKGFSLEQRKAMLAFIDKHDDIFFDALTDSVFRDDPAFFGDPTAEKKAEPR